VLARARQPWAVLGEDDEENEIQGSQGCVAAGCGFGIILATAPRTEEALPIRTGGLRARKRVP